MKYEEVVKKLNILYDDKSLLDAAISVLERLKQDIEREEQIKNETYEEYVDRMNYDR